MKYGLKKSRFDYVLFLDSDLIGLKVSDLNRIIEPVLNKKVDVTFCLHGNSPWKFMRLDYLSGLRCIKKSLLGDYSFLDGVGGFGAEVSMNKVIIKKNLRIGVVSWPNVISPVAKEDGSAFKKYMLITGAARKAGGGFFRLFLMICRIKKNSVFLG